VRRTKAELYADAKRQRIPLCPIATPADLVSSPQLLARGFFVDVPDGIPGTTLRMPGGPYQPTDSPWRIRRPAPALGEHTDEVLGQLAVDSAAAAGPGSSRTTAGSAR
jgi:benzylsuccinate CoA-transferase BbsE subunit